MKEITLTQGQVALVDDEDFPLVSSRKWHARWDKKMQCFYASAADRLPGGRRTTIEMHRVIMGLALGDGRKVDHVDPGKTLDNRRSNLRIATHGQNMMNKRLRTQNSSGYKGVSACFGKWRARVTVDGEQVYLGLFDTPEAAAAARNRVAKDLHGEFARTA